MCKTVEDWSVTSILAFLSASFCAASSSGDIVVAGREVVAVPLPPDPPPDVPPELSVPPLLPLPEPSVDPELPPSAVSKNDVKWE